MIQLALRQLENTSCCCSYRNRSRYRSHKHPHMEDLIYLAGEMLNQQIESERVRQMHFLSPSQHIALHFKVTADHVLHFIYASIISEREVILQTRPQLLMSDPCMTERLAGAALLPGGSERRAVPYEGPELLRRHAEKESTFMNESQDRSGSPCQTSCTVRTCSLPPIDRSHGMSHGRSRRPASAGSCHSGSSKSRRRVLLDSGLTSAPVFIPKTQSTRPELPSAPFYYIRNPIHKVEESGRFECFPPSLSRQPLVSTCPPQARSVPFRSSFMKGACVAERSVSQNDAGHHLMDMCGT